MLSGRRDQDLMGMMSPQQKSKIKKAMLESIDNNSIVKPHRKNKNDSSARKLAVK